MDGKELATKILARIKSLRWDYKLAVEDDKEYVLWSFTYDLEDYLTHYIAELTSSGKRGA